MRFTGGRFRPVKSRHNHVLLKGMVRQYAWETTILPRDRCPSYRTHNCEIIWKGFSINYPWCTNKYCSIQNASKSALMSKKWELSIVVPQSDNATAIARMVMADKHPWCLLIPTNLIHYISQTVGGKFDM